MDRTLRKDYDWLLSRPENAYNILNIDKSATLDQIKKAYRKEALIYHPDKNKNSDAVEKFRLINISYKVLSNTTLKSQYDDQLNLNDKKSINSHLVVDAKISKFKSDLIKRENDYNNIIANDQLIKKKQSETDDWLINYNKTNKTKINIKKTNKNSLSSFKTSKLPTSVIVKWKNKQNVIFDHELLEKLFHVFGTVTNVKLDENNKIDDNYNYAEVEFSSPVYAALAAANNYNKTADYWNHLNLRKISSLLRSVKFKNQHFQINDPLKASKLDYIAYCIMQQ